MPREDWGVKRVCPTTGKRFYDMRKSPIVSPYTGEIVTIDVPGRKGSASQDAGAKSKVVAAAALEEDEVLLDDDDIAVDADDDLLDEDDEDTVSLDDLSDVASEDDEV
jgi:uncharacterized protein (TIGR02300 family)